MTSMAFAAPMASPVALRAPAATGTVSAVSAAGAAAWPSKRSQPLLSTLALTTAVGAAKAGRFQPSRARRLARIQRLNHGASGEAPLYPGVEDPEKLMTFARDLCEFYRSSSKARLPVGDVIRLLEDSQRLFQQEETLVNIEVPSGEYMNVVGDVHGQLFDFLSIFEANGWPSDKNPFLFNGDFVDRGSYSVEIMLILLAFKLALPKHFFLSRGNHEEETMNHYYGFTGEVLAKYDVELMVWVAFQRVFMCLPLAHVINKDVFVTHGGLPRISEELSLETINALDRVKVSAQEEREESRDEDIIYNDLMWADPFEGKGIRVSQRGGSARMFGSDITEKFLQKNDLSFMIRSHEVKEEGFEWMHNKKCLTVFSAPQYCDSGDNLGAVVRLHADEADKGRLRPEIRTFGSAEKPQDYVYAMSYVRATQTLWPQALQKAGVNVFGS